MGRLVVIVAAMVAIAFLADRYLIKGGDAPPAGAAKSAPADKAARATSAEATAPADVDAAPATPVEEDGKEAGESLSLKPATTEVAETAVATKDAAAEEAGDKEEQAAEAVVAPVAPQTKLAEEPILLGVDELYDGIPGEGDLTDADIEEWLADPKNSVVLKPQLPVGLDAGAGEIKGLDKNPLTRAKIELGRQLYFDPRLSKDGSVSCASCHDPEFGFAKDTVFGVGIGGQTGNRNSPVAYNRILSDVQFWDGRAASLEEQAKGPIANPIEMGHTHDACIAGLKKVPGYVKQFELAFPGIGLTIDTVAQAIASFERSIVTGPAPWDHYQALKSFEQNYADDVDPEYIKEFEADEPELYAQYVALKKAVEANPISESAIRGGEIFFGAKGNCTACHVGANYSDEKYHNLGVGMDAKEPDLGRFVITKEEADKGAFKTPTCRNVATSAPYMHDGSQETLEEVVEWYDKGGHPNEHLDKNVRKLGLSEQEKKDLVAFMKEGLTGKFPKIETGRLPK